MPYKQPSPNVLYAGALLVLAVVLYSCSTTKDGFAYRAYHNTTAHFNGHFNAGESVKKGVEKIHLAHQEDYDEILPIFIYGTEETAKESYPEMEKAIGKCEKVIGRHTMTNEAKKNKKRPKFNKWIDENYMLIGQSYFYKKNFFKAEEVFQFVSRKYKEKDTQATSATWLARTYIARKEYSKAVQALNRVEIEGDIPDDIKADYYLVAADNFLHQDKLAEAAEKIELALKYIPKKRAKARPHFILAQIYQRLNQSTEAQREYDAVINSRPPYELEFYSRINKALAFSRRGGSSAEIRKELMKLLKDEKNVAYRDQIYFALGEISLEDQNRTDAIAYFEQSLSVSDDKSKQKAKTFLRLADLYFDQRQYGQAQVNYDSTFPRITELHPRYREVKARAESLTELIGYLDTIVLNDSLLSLCDKAAPEQEKIIRRAQKKMQDEMDRKRVEDEARAAQAMEDAATSVSGTFWCYNENLRSKGFDNFQEYWGDRPLKDNWRLQSRLTSSFGSPDESIVTIKDGAAGPATNEDLYKVPTLDELRAQLPCNSDDKMKATRADVAEAYYQAGVIYKEKLNDEDNAISSWEQLVLNLDESAFHPVAHYQLFRTWLSKEQLSNYKANPFCSTCSSVYWGDQIKSVYPGSEWAKLVDNPEYFDIKELKETEEREAYEAAYKLYTDRNYPQAMTACATVIANEPENHLLCKYRLLRAVSVGYTDAAYGIKENYLAELRSVVENCSGSGEAERANELMRAAMDEGGTSSLNETPKPDESTGTTSETDPIAQDIYSFSETAEHYFVLVLPTQGVNVNTIKAQITDYNTEYYGSTGLKVTNNLLDKNTHIILVKPFKQIPEAKEYGKSFTGNNNRLGDINSAGYTTFLISKPNYIQLFKSKDLPGYLTFFEANY